MRLGHATTVANHRTGASRSLRLLIMIWGADPKPFLGYSDDTNLLCWLWTNGIAGFHGGSTQVQVRSCDPSASVDCSRPRTASRSPAHLELRGPPQPPGARHTTSTPV